MLVNEQYIDPIMHRATVKFLNNFCSIFKYQISWHSIRWGHSCYMQAGGLTHMMKPILAYRNFANIPKKAHTHMQV